jgi:hypothetical protein
MHSNTDPTRPGRRAAGRVVLGVLTVAMIPAGLAVAGPSDEGWSQAAKIDEHPDVNTASLDGCPAQSPTA